MPSSQSCSVRLGMLRISLNFVWDSPVVCRISLMVCIWYPSFVCQHEKPGNFAPGMALWSNIFFNCNHHNALRDECLGLFSAHNNKSHLEENPTSRWPREVKCIMYLDDSNIYYQRNMTFTVLYLSNRTLCHCHPHHTS